MTDQIQLYLLRRQPVVVVNGEVKSLNVHALRLLIYVADNGDSQYARTELVDVLYGTQEGRHTFRKKALFEFRKFFTDELVVADGGDVNFTVENISVDSRDFEQLALEALQWTSAPNKDTYALARTALDLYKEPFLQDFQPQTGESADDHRFHTWQKRRQSDLEALFYRLLDLIIPHYLEQERNWGQAKQYALRWMRSRNSGVKPLQYLIWLAYREKDDSLNAYLAELRAREESGELPIGPSWAHWNQLLKSERSIPLSILLTQEDVVENEPDAITRDKQIDRPEIVDRLISLLTSERDQRIFALTGLPGVGKTEVTRILEKVLQKQYPNYTVAMVELTKQFDMEFFCNAILHALGKQDLLALNYAERRQRLKQLLKTPKLILIIDEGHTTHLAVQEMLDMVLSIVTGTATMLVARKLPRFDNYVIELDRLDSKHVTAFLVEQVPWLAETKDNLLPQVVELSRGLPLLLHIIVGGLKKDIQRLHALLESLEKGKNKSKAAFDVFALYEQALTWLWEYLDSKDKDLFYALSLFAPNQGTHDKDLAVTLLGVFARTHVQSRLNQFADLHLITRLKASNGSSARYLLHPIILDFVRRYSERTARPHTQTIEQSYVKHVLEIVETHYEESHYLDEYQQDIFQMFEIVLFSDRQSWAQSRSIDALIRLYPYFERRSLYSRASQLFEHVRENIEIESPATRVSLLFYSGKLANAQSKQALALDLFSTALALEDNLPNQRHRGGLFHAIGNILLDTEQYTQAMEIFGSAADWARINGRTTLLYSIWSNMGLCMYRQGHFEHALDYYQRVSDQLGEHPDALSLDLQIIAQYVYHATGLTLSEVGQYEQGNEYFQKSINLSRLTGNQELTARLYLGLGTSHIYAKQLDAAHDYYALASAIAEQSQLFTLQIETLVDIAQLTSMQDKSLESFRLFRRALLAIDDFQITWLKPIALIKFGKAYIRAELYEQAQRCFIEVLEQHSVSPRFLAEALYGLALSVLAQIHHVGRNDLDGYLNRITQEFALLLPHYRPIEALVAFLDRVKMTFHRDIEQIPEIERFRIVEVLTYWIQSQAQTQ